MKLLLDTHLLVWAMGDPSRLGPALRELLEDPQHTLWFSAVSLWELVSKAGLGREGFQVQPSLLRARCCTAILLIACCSPRPSAKA